MLASSYPLLDIFWTILEIFAFIVYFWLIIGIFTDIFRSHDLGGISKFLWIVAIMFLPLIGIFLYLILRGGSMHERAAQQAAAQQKAFDSYVKQAAGTSGGTAEELAKLADLKEKGVINDEEFAAEKAKILS